MNSREVHVTISPKNCRFCEPRVISCTLRISFNKVWFCSLPLIPRKCILRHRNFSHRPREGSPCHVLPLTDSNRSTSCYFLECIWATRIFPRRVQPSHHSVSENSENFTLRSTSSATCTSCFPSTSSDRNLYCELVPLQFFILKGNTLKIPAFSVDWHHNL